MKEIKCSICGNSMRKGEHPSIIKVRPYYYKKPYLAYLCPFCFSEYLELLKMICDKQTIRELKKHWELLK